MSAKIGTAQVWPRERARNPQDTRVRVMMAVRIIIINLLAQRLWLSFDAGTFTLTDDDKYIGQSGPDLWMGVR